MKLQDAFGIIRGDVVAFIGAGGKSASLIALGYELAEAAWRVLATSTSSIAEEELELFPLSLHYQTSPQRISEAINEHGFVFLYSRIEDGRVYGTSIEWTKELLDNIDSDVLLVEADGADGMLLKAPYEHEPFIPKEVSLVIPVVALGIIDQPLDQDHVYNPQVMIEKFGFYEGARIPAPWVAQVLRDEEMGLRGIPDHARVVAFINQTPAEGYLRNRARLIARLALKSTRLHAVALGSVRLADPICEVQRPLAAMVLAAGQSSRMGEPKVLLPWTKGKTIIEHIVEQLLRSRIETIHVVTGFYADEVKRVLKPYDVTFVHNRAHRTGEMLSSLKAGFESLPEQIAAAFIVLGDQPRMQPKVLYQLQKAYAEGTGELIAPSYQMRRGHPILVGRRYWQDFLDLRGDESPRKVFDAHAKAIHYITVDSDSILRDVDTPQDYEQERFKAGLERLERPYRKDS